MTRGGANNICSDPPSISGGAAIIDIQRMVFATDWPVVRDIYADGLATSLFAFLSNPPSQNEWDRAYLPFGRIVARVGDAVHGWAALTPVADA